MPGNPSLQSSTFLIFIDSATDTVNNILNGLVSLWLKGYLTPGFKLIIIDYSSAESYSELQKRIDNLAVLQPEYVQINSDNLNELEELKPILNSRILTNIVFYWVADLDLLVHTFSHPYLATFITSQRIHFAYEPPFGANYETALRLNKFLEATFEPQFIYRCNPGLYGYNFRLMSQLKQIDTATQSLFQPQNMAGIKLQLEPNLDSMLINYFTCLQILTPIGYDINLDIALFAKTEFIESLNIHQTGSSLKLTSTAPKWEGIPIHCELTSHPEYNLRIEFQPHVSEPLELSGEDNISEELTSREYCLQRICKGDPSEFPHWNEIAAMWKVIAQIDYTD